MAAARGEAFGAAFEVSDADVDRLETLRQRGGFEMAAFAPDGTCVARARQSHPAVGSARSRASRCRRPHQALGVGGGDHRAPGRGVASMFGQSGAGSMPRMNGPGSTAAGRRERLVTTDCWMRRSTGKVGSPLRHEEWNHDETSDRHDRRPLGTPADHRLHSLMQKTPARAARAPESLPLSEAT